MLRVAIPALCAAGLLAGCESPRTPAGAPVVNDDAPPAKRLQTACQDYGDGSVQAFAPYDQRAHGRVTSYLVLCSSGDVVAVKI